MTGDVRERKRNVLGWVLVALIATLLLRLVIVNAAVTTTSTGNSGGGTAVAMVSSLAPIALAGNAIAPISPGVSAPLDVTLTNPYDSAVTVTGLRTTVLGVDSPNADGLHPCTVGDFVVEQSLIGLEVLVPAGATTKLSSLGVPPASWPQVGMVARSVNQDGCKGSSVTLDYAAAGELER
ncbi:MAG: hypothetical protein ACOH2F_12625 [Cellulomonas sp.]